MDGALNIISVVSAFVFGTGVIYWLLDATVGRLRFLNSRFEWHGLQVKDFAFLLVAVVVLLTFFTFVRPYS